MIFFPKDSDIFKNLSIFPQECCGQSSGGGNNGGGGGITDFGSTNTIEFYSQNNKVYARLRYVSSNSITLSDSPTSGLTANVKIHPDSASTLLPTAQGLRINPFFNSVRYNPVTKIFEYYNAPTAGWILIPSTPGGGGGTGGGHADTATYAETAGYAEEAGHADSADLAARATLADTATYAQDSDKWDGYQFADYLDQPVKTNSHVRFRSISSTAFTSGSFGSGWRIDENGNAELDNLSVRKSLTVPQLKIKEIVGVGGSFAVTDSMRISRVQGNVCYFETQSGTIFNYFRVDDLIRCQRWDGTGVKYYTARVTATALDNFTVTVIDGTGLPAAGDDVFRFGNVTDVTRQSLIYMTNADTNAPYLDVIDGLNSTNFAGKTKVRLGNLTGIVDPTFGALTGYGLYGDNVYITNGKFKGQVEVTGGNVLTQDQLNDTLENLENITKQYTDNEVQNAIIEAVQQSSALVDNLEGILDPIALNGILDLAKQDSTFITGGYLQTNTIFANWVNSKVITANLISAINSSGTGTINANRLNVSNIITVGGIATNGFVNNAKAEAIAYTDSKLFNATLGVTNVIADSSFEYGVLQAYSRVNFGTAEPTFNGLDDVLPLASGAKVMKADVIANGAATYLLGDNRKDIPTNFPVEAGQQYTFSFAYKLTGGTNTTYSISIEEQNPGGNITQNATPGALTVGNTSWETVSFTFTVDDDTDSIKIKIGLAGQAGQVFYVDTLKLSKGASVGEWTISSEDVLIAQQAAINAVKAYADDQDLITRTEAIDAAIDDSDTKRQELINQLKSLAYLDIEEVALNGQTIIQNGKINTVLLDATAIRASIINAGYINTLALDASVIKSGVIDSARINANQIVVSGGGATTAQLNALNIGGVNLLTGTKTLSGNVFPANNTNTNYNGLTIAKVTGIAGYIDTFQQTTPSLTELEYTVSFFAKTDEPSPLQIFNYFYNPNTTTHAKTTGDWVATASDGGVSITVDNVWRRYSISWRQSVAGSPKYLTLGRLNGQTGRTFSIAGIKFEKGNKGTDWSLAGADYGTLAFENLVEKSRLGTTIIDGGLIRTDLVNASAIVVAGGGVNSSQVNTQIGAAWNAISFGITNLLVDSGKSVTNNTYNIAQYDIIESLTASQELTITLWGTLGSDRNQWLIYNSGATTQVTILDSSNLIAPGVYRKTFPWVVGSGNNKLYVWQAPDGGTSSSTITKIKLEKGNKGTDWSESPQDKIEKAKLGNTIIQGGYIAADLLDIAAIRAGTVTAAYINTLQLDAASIKTGKFSADRLELGSIFITPGQVTGFDTAVDNAIDDVVSTLKVATRNLIKNSFSGNYIGPISYWNNNGGTFTNAVDGKSVLFQTSSPGQGLYTGITIAGIPEQWKPSTDYVVQFEVLADNFNETTNKIRVGPEGWTVTPAIVNLIPDGSKWIKYTVKFTSASSINVNQNFTIYNANSGNGAQSFHIKNIFVGEGNTIAAFTDSPEALADKFDDQITSSLEDLSEELSEVFADDIITVSEAAAISKNLNALKDTMTQATTTYDSVYNNTALTNPAKQNLLNAKNILNSSFTTLETAINNAIADNKVNQTEKDDINNKYITFRNNLGTFTTVLEAAYDNIQSNAITTEVTEQVSSITDEILEELDKYSQDNILTALEKKSVKVTIDAIKQEYPKLISLAGQYGITTTNNYTTAYNNLVTNYLNALLVPGTTLNQDSTIDRTQFNQRFEIYATEMTALRQLIDTFAKSALDSKTTVFGYISTVYKAGDLMILPQDSTHNGVTVCNGNIPESRVYKGKTVYKAQNSRNCHMASDWIEIGPDLNNYYTKAQTDTQVNLAVNDLRTRTSKIYTNPDPTGAYPSNYKKTDLWIPSATQGGFTKGLGYIANTDSTSFNAAHWAAGFEYSVGEDAVDLSVYQYLLDSTTKGTTVAIGGMILTSLIAMRDTTTGAVRSYMSGQASVHNIAFAAGVNQFAISGGETGKLQLMHDGSAKFADGKVWFDQSGSGYVANNKISWDTAGNLTVQGTIVAGSAMGGWTIGSNGLAKTTAGGTNSYWTTTLNSVAELSLYYQAANTKIPTTSGKGQIERKFLNYLPDYGMHIYDDGNYIQKNNLTLDAHRYVRNYNLGGTQYSKIASYGETRGTNPSYYNYNLDEDGYDIALSIVSGFINLGTVLPNTGFTTLQKGTVRWATVKDINNNNVMALVIDGADNPAIGSRPPMISL